MHTHIHTQMHAFMHEKGQTVFLLLLPGHSTCQTTRETDDEEFEHDCCPQSSSTAKDHIATGKFPTWFKVFGVYIQKEGWAGHNILRDDSPDVND